MGHGFERGRTARGMVAAGALIAVCGLPSLAQAQDEDVFGWVREPFEDPIITERPTFSTSPQALPAGRFQLETGFDLQFDNAPGVDTEIGTLPLALLRYGVFTGVEVQVGWAGASFISTNGETTVGTGDLDLNVKVELTEQNGRMPNVGLFASISLPVGDETGSTNVDPSGGVLWSHALSQKLGLFGNILVAGPSNGEDRFFQLANSVGVSRALTPSLAVFAEYVAEFNTEVIDQHTSGFGFTYLINRNLQIDLNGGFGLSRGTPDGFLGGGVAYRW
ncbi:MAG: transporter [Alphaproteobacteria bacterium]